MNLENRLNTEIKKTGFFARLKKRILPYALLAAGGLCSLVGCVTIDQSELFATCQPGSIQYEEYQKKLNKKTSLKLEGNDKIVFPSYAEKKICVLDKDGKRKLDLTEGSEADDMPCLSPAQDKIAYVAMMETRYSKALRMFVMNTNGSQRKKLANIEEWVSSPSWSPDGRKIAFKLIKLIEGFPTDIGVIDSDGSNYFNLTQTENLNEDSFSWSPDSKRIVFDVREKLDDLTMGHYSIYDIEAKEGAKPRLLAREEGADCGNPKCSPDGKSIAFNYIQFRDFVLQPPKIAVMNSDGSDKRVISASNILDADFFWSPDGKHIACNSSIDGGEWDVDLIDVADIKNRRNISNNPSWDKAYGWLPDGKAIAILSGRDGTCSMYLISTANSTIQTLLTKNCYSDTYKLDSSKKLMEELAKNFEKIANFKKKQAEVAKPLERERRPIPEKPIPAEQPKPAIEPRTRNDTPARERRPIPEKPIPAEQPKPAIEPAAQNLESRLLFAGGEFPKRKVYLKDKNTITCLTEGDGDFAEAVWSPSNSKIAYVMNSSELFTMNPTGSDKRKISSLAMSPSWSPDGKLISFIGLEEGAGYFDLFVAKADGSEKLNLTKTKSASEAGPAVWSNDGNTLVCAIFQSGNFDLVAVNKDNSSSRKITDTPNEDEHSPVFTSDGQVAYQKGIIYFDKIAFFKKSLSGSQDTSSQMPAWQYYIAASKVKNPVNESKLKEIFESLGDKRVGPVIISPDCSKAVAFVEYNKAAAHLGADYWSGLYEFNLKTGEKKLIQDIIKNPAGDSLRLRSLEQRIEAVRQAKNLPKGREPLCIMNSDGSGKRTLEGVINAQEKVKDVSWSPKGDGFIISTKDKNYFVNAEQQSVKELDSPLPKMGFAAYMAGYSERTLDSLLQFIWSPNGEYIFFLKTKKNAPIIGSTTTIEFSICNTKDLSTIVSVLYPTDMNLPFFCWSKDSTKLLFATVKNEPGKDIKIYHEGEYSHTKSSRNNIVEIKYLKTCGDQKFETIKIIKKTFGGRYSRGGSFLSMSPEGNYISTDDECGYLLNFIDDSAPRELKNVQPSSIRWSPDGRKLVYKIQRIRFDEGTCLYDIDADKMTQLPDDSAPWDSEYNKKIDFHQIKGQDKFILDAYFSPKGDKIVGHPAIMASQDEINNALAQFCMAAVVGLKRGSSGCIPEWSK